MNEKPKLLYHYASIEAFRGILDDQCLRMTKYDQMNDSKEVILALEIMKDFLSSYNCAKKYKEFKEYLLELLEKYKELPFYITSFSEKANDLEQWRAYTPNGGVAIGFDFEEVRKGYIIECSPEGEYNKKSGVVERKDGRGWEKGRYDYLFQCEYDSKKTKKNIKKKIISWFSSNQKAETYLNMKNGVFYKFDKTGDVKYIMELFFYNDLSSILYSIIVATKHEVYSGEKEWRWMNIEPNPKNFIKRLDEKNRLYVKARIDREDFIKEVWISPHGKTDVIKRVVNFYKEKYKLPYEIHKSEIPYRLT